MQTTYDPEADILMIELVNNLTERLARGQRLEVGGAYVDLDAAGNILGIEIMDASKRYTAADLRGHPEPKMQMGLAEAAQLAGVKPQALRKACERGRLAGQKIGRDWIVRVDDLNAYLSSRRHAGPGSAAPVDHASEAS